jgi:uncharacterized protein YuzE
MKLEYDPKADAAYITLVDVDVVDSEEVKPGIVVDYDAQNRIVGIEVLHVRKRLPDADPKQVRSEVA